MLVVSFVALATLWPRPRLDPLRERDWRGYPRWLDPLCGAIGIALFVLIVYAGIAGAQLPYSNITPTWIYVVFWVGLALASVLFGDAFRPFNPWRAIARATAWIAARVRGMRRRRAAALPGLARTLAGGARDRSASPGSSSPRRSTLRDEPDTLAFLSLGYAAVQLVGMSLYGIETWTDARRRASRSTSACSG